MTKEETVQLLMMISAAYPNFKVENKQIATKTWHMMLGEYDKNVVFHALKLYIATSTTGFAPDIGSIIAKINDMQKAVNQEELNEMQAWALVSKALRNGYYGAEKEFAALPETVQKAVGTPSNLRNWAQTDIESVENVIQSNFMRTYRAILKREEEKAKIPEGLRIATENIMRIGENGNGNDGTGNIKKLPGREE